jgi:predicted AAA+ superfamily ATPase
MNQADIYKPRWLAGRIREAIEFSPVVVLSGARQTGKSTLLRNEPPFREWRYVSFDDLDILSLASKRPDEILSLSKNMVIDEAQRSPDFIYAVKRAVDKDRTRRIVLSGSANLLLMKTVPESLAGRAVYFNLMPFAHAEYLERKKENWFLHFLEKGELPSLQMKGYVSSHEIREDIAFSLFRGFLPPVIFLKKESHISMWWKGYIKTYLERDLRDISAISYLPDFKKMMELLSLRTASILNQSEIARDTALSQATAGRYINTLEETNLFLKIRPYSKNISKRLIKSPKIFVLDPGLAASLAGHSSSSMISQQFKGSLLESFVCLNLMARAALHDGQVCYFRTQGGKEKEVDFIFEKNNKIAGIEVKLSDSISVKDMDNLLFLKDISDRFIGGLIIYSGREIKQLGKNIFAVPWNIF